MTIIFINNKKYDVNESDNLLHICLSLGFDIPYFCWHPALGSVGACRQCIVKQYHSFEDKIGRLVVSCMTSIVEGLIISTDDHESKDFRKSVTELLMTNHPHDCPVCEEGGSCHLQDMTVMNKHYIRRYRFKKRTHNNQYLGSFIGHEMNRCISCYRCVRYYKDYSDGIDFGVYGISNNVYFGRLEEGPLDSEFSGNLIDVCPTGVFTDKIQSEKYTRKWDLQYAPSICQHCCIGCNITAGEKYGEICKIENRYHGSINRYFLCDLGRFSYSYSNLQDRPRYSVVRFKNEEKVLESVDSSIELITKRLVSVSKVLGIGSSRASLESNYALQNLVGIEHFSVGMLQNEWDCVILIIKILKNSGIYTPTLREIEEYDTILILGEDITQTSPMIALSVRQAVKGKSRSIALSKNIPKWHTLAIKNVSQKIRNKLFIINTHSTKLDDISEASYFCSINNQVKLSFEIAHKIDRNFSNVSNLSENEIIIVEKIVYALLSSKNPLIISGSHSNSIELIQAAHNIAKALKNIKKRVGLVLLTSASNSLGVGLLEGISLERAMNSILEKKYDSLIILENDLYRYFPKSKVKQVFNNVKNILVIDHINTNTMKKAHIALPVTNSFESSGTVVNYESRAQRFFQVYDPNFYGNNWHILDSWMWLHRIDCTLRKKHQMWYRLDDVVHSIFSDNLNFKQLRIIAPDSSFKVFGQKLARSPHRCSGRTSVRSNIDVHEISQPEDKNSMFSFSMEGCQQSYKHSSYIPFAWVPGWNSIQAWNKFQKNINGELYCGDSGKRLCLYDSNKSMPWFDNTLVGIFHKNYSIFPYYLLFGSEQLSQLSPVIKRNTLKDAIGMISKQDADCLSVQSGSTMEFSYFDTKFVIKVKVSSEIESGQLGLLLGYLDIPLFLSRRMVVNLRKITV
ncbi:NADH-quinone oxidoreductase subunit NuoG [Buchnera aphidicola]|uniref:NADH-quinone oxidoreductase n=1 Tax=Buchnera aphidicola subsp. Melaphis rhois TaxID=118103 RepID=A0A4D6Y0Z5_BUCMH|nr:NADH-quinone oxidoreductase subunit NuoG [Buchnera aphidicola]QCI23186.1 NADH-quinone oxidoreductase subunit NuoG [Buchnera aphidicola (Melaphis rhois)]